MKLKVAFILFLFSLYSCIKSNSGEFDFSEIRVSPEYAFPIGQANILFEFYKGVGELEFVDTSGINIDSLLDSLFYYDQDFYKIPEKISYDLPLQFSLGDFSESLEEITSFTIRTNLITEIPGDAETQVYFMHGSDTLDELFDSPFKIEGAYVSENGNIVSTDLITTEAIFEDTNRINNLLNTDTILISTSLKIPSLDSINTQYTGELSTWIQVAVKLSLNVGLK